MTASLGDSLFANALSCAVSVLKADHVQDRAATSHVRRKISVSMATKGPFWFVTFLFDVLWTR